MGVVVGVGGVDGFEGGVGGVDKAYEIRDEFNPADYEEEGGQREQSGEEEVDFGVAELGFEGGEVLVSGDGRILVFAPERKGYFISFKKFCKRAVISNIPALPLLLQMK